MSSTAIGTASVRVKPGKRQTLEAPQPGAVSKQKLALGPWGHGTARRLPSGGTAPTSLPPVGGHSHAHQLGTWLRGAMMSRAALGELHVSNEGYWSPLGLGGLVGESRPRHGRPSDVIRGRSAAGKGSSMPSDSWVPRSLRLPGILSKTCHMVVTSRCLGVSNQEEQALGEGF